MRFERLFPVLNLMPFSVFITLLNFIHIKNKLSVDNQYAPCGFLKKYPELICTEKSLSV